MRARVGVAVSAAIAVWGSAAVCLLAAQAATADTGGSSTLCNYTMSDPAVVDVNGVPMVHATIEPSGCTGSAKPTFLQVCLSTPQTVGRCTELPGQATAHAYLSPYIPGTSYTVKGRGCAAVSVPPEGICSTLGPRSVTL
ncbi:MAG TPA: hypothetical protein VFW21_04010 [Mycobacterium sp.]|nr:hypothetical protein [Mycobacterium sp.]